MIKILHTIFLLLYFVIPPAKVGNKSPKGMVIRFNGSLLLTILITHEYIQCQIILEGTLKSQLAKYEIPPPRVRWKPP